MKKITQSEYNSLVENICDTLKSIRTHGLGDMDSCFETAKCIVNNWCEQWCIEITQAYV